MTTLTIQLQVDIPPHLPDSLQQTPEAFAQEAKLAMAAKLYEMGRLSSGTAAALAGMDRMQFLHELQHYKVPMIDLDAEELRQDIAHA
jgi:predicted HTH domain antitoxin